MFDPEQLAHRRPHQYHLPFRSGSRRLQASRRSPSEMAQAASTFSYDSYDDGIDFARLSHP